MSMQRVLRPVLFQNQNAQTIYVSLLRMTTSASVTDHAISSEVRPYSEIPGPKGLYRIPYLGSAFLFKPFTPHLPGDITDVFSSLRDKYRDIFKVRLGKDDMVHVSHPDYAKTVLQAPYKDHTRTRLDLSLIYCERTGKQMDLPLLEGEEWLAMRRPAQEKMLKPAVVATYIPLIEKVTNDFIERLEKKHKIDDLLKELTNYTTESVGMLCFNRRLNSFDDTSDETVASAVENIFIMLQKSLFMPVKTFNYFETALYKEYAKQQAIFTRIARKELETQKEFLTKTKEEGRLDEYLQKEPNFMYSLLSDPRLSTDQVNSLVQTLFGAGVDSTANTMVFLLVALAKNPEKQENLYQEIKRVVGDSDTLTKEHLSQMSYLKACTKESQRKTFPTSIGGIRILESDLVVGGYLIPKSSMVAINMQLMSSDERFYPKATEFIPERWLRDTTGELAKGQQYPYAFKPFGFGVRNCIGQRFAENEIYIGITKIIQNFHVSLPSDATEIQPSWKIFTSPSAKVGLNLKKRKS